MTTHSTSWHGGGKSCGIKGMRKRGKLGPSFSEPLICQEGGAPNPELPRVKRQEPLDILLPALQAIFLKPELLILVVLVTSSQSATRRSTILKHITREEEGGGLRRPQREPTGGAAVCPHTLGSVALAAGLLICQGWWFE